MWYTGRVEHEGFPLHLRFPEKPDFDSLQRKYPKLVTVTHSFTKVKPSGEPESEYNQSLADFDHDLITAFEPSTTGIVVLVETFGGRRMYYFYVTDDAVVSPLQRRFTSDYPQHNLEWEIIDDQNWNFIRNYSEDYKFYKGC